MASTFAEFDPGRVVFSYNGLRIVGYMDGTVIVAERDEDAFSASSGAGGDVVRVRSRNKMGTVTLTLQQTSPSNLELSDLFNDDEDPETATGFGEIQIDDLDGDTLLHAENAWIKKPSNVEFGTDLSGREWVFGCAELNFTVGGNI